MNHKHRKTSQALFAHPISSNINFKEMVHVLEELGVQIENKSGNRIGVSLNGHSAAFIHAQHDLPKEEIALVRNFLSLRGIDPTEYPA